MLLYSQIIARLPLFFPECSSISGKVCVTPPVAVSRFSQGKGRQYRRTWIWAKQPAYAMQREQESLHHSRREKWFHAGVRHEKGAPGQFFSLSHMHYVGRSFRLLNQFSRPSPAHSERFSGRKFHRTEIFCRKPKGKRGVPQGRTNFDEEGENHPFHKYHFLRWHRIFPSPSFPAYGTGFPCRC